MNYKLSPSQILIYSIVFCWTGIYMSVVLLPGFLSTISFHDSPYWDKRDLYGVVIYILCKNTETEEQQLRAVMPFTPSNILRHTGWQKFVLFHQEFSFRQWYGRSNYVFPPELKSVGSNFLVWMCHCHCWMALFLY